VGKSKVRLRDNSGHETEYSVCQAQSNKVDALRASFTQASVRGLLKKTETLSLDTSSYERDPRCAGKYAK